MEAAKCADPVAVAYRCKFCGGSRVSEAFVAREMMYGTRERFTYQKCSECGSLQIDEVPADLGRHYRADEYSSWLDIPDHIRRVPTRGRQLLMGWRAEAVLYGRNFAGQMLRRVFGEPDDNPMYAFDWEWLRRCGLGLRDRILDFGCGTGNLLFYLRANGFHDLHGYDRFAASQCREPGLVIHSEDPRDLDRTFRFAMANHVLEHIPEPATVLQRLFDAISDDGSVLIRVPIASSWAFEEYGADWVQLDAPRHVAIPSEQGMHDLAERLGFKVEYTRFDSGLMQFMGSESYRADVPMFRDRTSESEPEAPSFDDEWRARMLRFAAELNAKHRGDQAGFILKRR